LIPLNRFDARCRLAAWQHEESDPAGDLAQIVCGRQTRLQKIEGSISMMKGSKM
jgi:hypothetical protein